MILTKLKAKNQLTIPIAIVKRLRLRIDELFTVDVEGNSIRLVPVKVEPRYSEAELRTIDQLVENEQDQIKVLTPGKDFSRYVKKITK